VQPRRGQCLVQRRPVGTLAALDFGVFVDDLPVATVEIGCDGRALRFEAQAALALAAGRNPVISLSSATPPPANASASGTASPAPNGRRKSSAPA
jgi:hypothetical protein